MPQHIPRPAGARPGGRTPWHDRAVSPSAFDLDEVLRRLAAPHPYPPTLEPFAVRRSSAVLIALGHRHGQLSVVLTRRPAHLRAQPNDVSLPGGGSEPGDADLVATALREAQEEVGLAPERLTVVGRLDPLATLTVDGSAPDSVAPVYSVLAPSITPIVALADDLDSLRPDPAEVDEVLVVPLASLLAEGVHREEVWPIPEHARDLVRGWHRQHHLDDAGVGPDWRTMQFFELERDTVWGATARIVTRLLDQLTAAAVEPSAAGAAGTTPIGR